MLSNIFLLFFVCLIALAAAIFTVAIVYSTFFGAPFVPMDKRRAEEMMRVAGIKSGEKVVDLGSGDGRVLIAAAKAGAKAEGWEINPFLWLWSKWNIQRAGVAKDVIVHLGSYWSVNFSDSDVVALFLIHTQMPRMEKKLRQELRPGARVVSFAFQFPEWKAESRSEERVALYRQI